MIQFIYALGIVLIIAGFFALITTPLEHLITRSGFLRKVLAVIRLPVDTEFDEEEFE